MGFWNPVALTELWRVIADSEASGGNNENSNSPLPAASSSWKSAGFFPVFTPFLPDLF